MNTFAGYSRQTQRAAQDLTTALARRTIDLNHPQVLIGHLLDFTSAVSSFGDF